MDEIIECLKRYGVSADQFKKTVAELCKNGIANGCYDTTCLVAVLEIFSKIERSIKNN